MLAAIEDNRWVNKLIEARRNCLLLKLSIIQRMDNISFLDVDRVFFLPIAIFT